MAYRDEVGALRARCEALERELDVSRRELSQLRGVNREKEWLEERVTELELTLIELRRQLGPPQGPRPVPGVVQRNMALFSAAVVALVGAFSLHVLQMAHRHEVAAHHYRALNEQARLAEVARQLDGLEQDGWSNRFAPVLRQGQVVNASGHAPVNDGEACTVDVTPAINAGAFNCRVAVRCGEELIYGGPMLGYMTCSVNKNVPRFGRDDGVTRADGDPQIELDLDGDRVLVSDGPRQSYSVELSLDR